ncbi:MAG: TIGR04282 family arsenosugar biosynthesis glycosyltransferase [Betaproteobacteria bacterium]
MLIVFAKAPVPGRVKTRLIPALGAAGAARLHAALLERTIATARHARCGAVELHGAPPAGHPLLRQLSRQHRLRLRSQSGAGLGERMHRSLQRGLCGGGVAVLIGSDCPVLGAADIRAAFAALHAGADAVIAPAEDGGYPLIGLRRASAELFMGIDWSTAAVLEQTRARLRRLGWKWKELRPLWDVDRPQDVRRLRKIRAANLTFT